MTAVGTAVRDQNRLNTFSVAALPGLPKGRFNVSHAQLYHLIQQMTQVAARLETPSAMHLNVSANSNAIPMLSWLTQTELRTVIYGVPNIPVPTDRRISAQSLTPGTPLSKEWFAIIFCDHWQMMLHALPTSTGQFACLLTQRSDVISEAIMALGADNRLTARAGQMSNIRDDATMRLLWRVADILPDANQIVAGLGPLAVPYGLTLVLIHREQDRWSLMAQAVTRLLADTKLTIFRLDSRVGMLQPFESIRPVAPVSLQANRLISRAVVGDLPLFGQENGASVAAMPIAIVGRVWGIAEYTRVQMFAAAEQMQIGLLTALIGVALHELGDTPSNRQSVIADKPVSATPLDKPLSTANYKLSTATTPAIPAVNPTPAKAPVPVAPPLPSHPMASGGIRLPSKLAVAELPAMGAEFHPDVPQQPADDLEAFSDYSFSASSDEVYWPDLDDFLRADDVNETLIAQRVQNGRDLANAARPLNLELDLAVHPASIERNEPREAQPPAAAVMTDAEQLATDLLRVPARPSQGATLWSDEIPMPVDQFDAQSVFGPLVEPEANAATFTPVAFTPVAFEVNDFNAQPVTTSSPSFESFRPVDFSVPLAAPDSTSTVLDPFLATTPAAVEPLAIPQLPDINDFSVAAYPAETDDVSLDLSNDPFYVPAPVPVPTQTTGSQSYTQGAAEPAEAFTSTFIPSFDLSFEAVDPNISINVAAWATTPDNVPLPALDSLPDMQPDATITPIVESVARDDWAPLPAMVEQVTAANPELEAFFEAPPALPETIAPISPIHSTNIPVSVSKNALVVATPSLLTVQQPVQSNRLPVSPMLNDLRLFLSRLRERVSRLPQVKSGFNATQTHLVAQVVSDVNSAIDALGDMALVADLNERLTRDAAWQRVDFGAMLHSLYAELKETAARRGLRLDWKLSQEPFYLRGNEELLAQCGRALIGGLLELTTTGTVYIRLNRADQGLNLTVTVPRSEALPKQSSAILPGFDQLNPKRNRLAVAKAILDYHGGNLTITPSTAATLDFTASLPLEQK